ncbi:hypothetical protein Angca_008457, partial [Angiostrongylus cantonensis]
ILIIYTARWQRALDDLRQLILEERFLVNDELNSYLLERHEPTELLRMRTIFLRLCQSVRNCDIVPPFIQYESRHMVALRYGVSTCVIYKNLSTIMTAIMCYLYNTLLYRQRVVDMTRDTYSVRFCKGKNEYGSIRALRPFRNQTSGKDISWLNIIVTRDPLERFISGFINKCLREKDREEVCYNCGNNIQCVMERQYERLMGVSQTPSLHHTVEDSHFAPQTWHCELRSNLRRYKLIKYSGSNITLMMNELDLELRKRGVPNDILQDIRSQVLRKRTTHETYNSHERVLYENQLRSSPYLMKLLVKMFYYDYLTFGYSLPNI